MIQVNDIVKWIHPQTNQDESLVGRVIEIGPGCGRKSSPRVKALVYWGVRRKSSRIPVDQLKLASEEEKVAWLHEVFS
jgi:hypothetical protein